MSLTVEQILNECRGDFPSTFKLEKEAASTSSVSEEDILKLVDLLKEASVPERTIVSPPQKESNIYEKIAEATILNSVLQTLDEEGIKLAEFREMALNNGHDPKEVNAFIEKKAKASGLSNLLKSQGAKTALKGIIGTGALAGATATGHHLGTKKQKATTRRVGQAAFTAGRHYQNLKLKSFIEQARKAHEGQK